MASTQKTITAAEKAAATRKAHCLRFVRNSPGVNALGMPKSYRTWLKQLEKEGLIEYRDGGWYTK